MKTDRAIATVIELLAERADPNAKDRAHNQFTVLMVAVDASNIDVILLLSMAGVDVHMKSVYSQDAVNWVERGIEHSAKIAELGRLFSPFI
jgi:hypothetical protein